MWMRLSCFRVALAIVLTGCYVEPSQEPQQPRVEVIGKEVKPKASTSVPGECTYGPGRGCFDGFLSGRRAVAVSGRSFFNADDLAVRFKELVLTGAEHHGKEDEPDNTTVSLVTPLDQASFVTGFEFELSGATKRSGRVRANGILTLHDLAPGAYDLRLARTIRFTTSFVRAPAAAPETKSHCAILFTDSLLEIQADQRSWESIGDFQLQMIGETCGTDF